MTPIKEELYHHSGEQRMSLVSEMKHAIDTAPAGKRIVTAGYQIFIHYEQIKNCNRTEMAIKLGLGTSFTCEVNKYLNLAKMVKENRNG